MPVAGDSVLAERIARRICSGRIEPVGHALLERRRMVRIIGTVHENDALIANCGSLSIRGADPWKFMRPKMSGNGTGISVLMYRPAYARGNGGPDQSV